MTSNFNVPQQSKPEAAREMDSLQRDRFELLSAYIDGEVTAAERYQVQEWLNNEPDVQRLYTRLLKLRGYVRKLPVPKAEIAPQETAQRVFARINRRRIKGAVVWGGGAIAALFVGTLSGILPGAKLIPQVAQSPQLEAAPEPLMIAVNRPAVEIPKAAVSSPHKLGQPLSGGGSADKNDVN